MNNINNHQDSPNLNAKQDDFILNLERASKIVSQWPEWKQKAWGPVLTDIQDSIIKNN